MHAFTIATVAALAGLSSATLRKRSGLGDVYNYYSGDGTTADGWPSQSEWIDFDDMWYE